MKIKVNEGFDDKGNHFVLYKDSECDKHDKQERFKYWVDSSVTLSFMRGMCSMVIVLTIFIVCLKLTEIIFSII